MEERSWARGAITVEAAIVLPVFICVVISLAMLIKLVYIHDIIQHAIDETANELATYSYVYKISDLQEIDDAVQSSIDNNSNQAQEHTEAFIGAYETMKQSLQTGKEGAADIIGISQGQGSFAEKASNILNQASNTYNTGAELTKENIQNIKDLQQILDEIGSNPRKEAESLAWMLSEGIYGDAKTVIAVPVIRQTVKKFLMQDGFVDIDRRLNKLNITNGLSGLDFYSSSFFKGNQDVDIVVKYRVELPLPIKLLPDIYIAQRSTARAWLEGGDGETVDSFDIWSLPNKQRGERIEEMFGGNLPYDFPVIDIYDSASKTGTSIKSINLKAKTYQNSEALNKKLISYVDALKEADRISYKNQNYSLQNKRFILVVPKGSLNEANKQIIQEMMNYAKTSGIQVTINEL